MEELTRSLLAAIESRNVETYSRVKDAPGQQDLFSGKQRRSSKVQKKLRWITIGGDHVGDAKHHGGTHVQIDDDGRIVSGPEALEGKSLDELKDKPKPDVNDSDEKPEAEEQKPEPKADPLQNVPDSIRATVERALNGLREIERQMEQAAATDRKFTGEGRYQAEVWDKIKGDQDDHNETLDEFRKHAPGEGVDADAALEALGGVPDLPFDEWDKNLAEHFGDDSESEATNSAGDEDDPQELLKKFRAADAKLNEIEENGGLYEGGSYSGTQSTPEYDAALEESQRLHKLLEEQGIDPFSGSEPKPDQAVVNVPLSKRGDIDAQIDRHKAEEAAAKKAKAKSDTAKRKEDKAVAKELFEKYGDGLAERTAAKHGKDKKEALDTLKSMVKWEPSKARELLERVASEQSEASEADEFNVQQAIKVSADDIGKLRKPDVFRVIEWTPGEHRQSVADYITQNRPDLADEVSESLADLKEESGNDDSGNTSAEPVEKEPESGHDEPESEPQAEESSEPGSGRGTITDIPSFNKFLNDLNSGEMTIDELKSGYEAFKANKGQFIADLKKTKSAGQLKSIASQLGNWDAGRNSMQKNAEGIYKRIATYFDPTDKGLQYSPFGGGGPTSEMEALDIRMSEITQADIQARADKRAEKVAQQEKMEENPETLAELSENLRMVGGYLNMKPEHRAAYDDLKAESTRSQRKEEKDPTTVKAEITSEEDHGGFSLSTNFHSKRGHDIFTASPSNRVDRDKYNEMNRLAKQLGGWYYKAFRGTPGGFHFPDEAKRDDFLKAMSGEAVDRSEHAAAKQAEKQEAKAETLAEYAARLEEKATASLNQERRDNTDRRARMADSARASAHADITKAREIAKIAEAVSNGEVKHLDGVSAGTHYDELSHAAYKAHRAAVEHRLKEKYGDDWRRNASRHELEQAHDGVFTAEDAAFAKMPTLDLYKWTAGRLIQQAAGTAGLKRDAAKWAKLMAASKGDDNFTELDGRQTKDFVDFVQNCRRKGLSEAKDFNWHTDSFKRMRTMGLHSDHEVRAALREFHKVTSGVESSAPSAAEENRKAERDIIRKHQVEGFFPTPKSVISEMLDHADIDSGHSVLEPSAGLGHILDAVTERHGSGVSLHAVEQHHELANHISSKGHSVDTGDFLEHQGQYDRVLMNPPFERDQAIDHVRHAFDQLKPGGKLVAVIPGNESLYANATRSKRSDFHGWALSNGRFHELPDNAFAGEDSLRKTGVKTSLLVLRKPEDGKEEYSRGGDPFLMGMVALQASLSAAIESQTETYSRGLFDESKHPRDHGKFTTKDGEQKAAGIAGQQMSLFHGKEAAGQQKTLFNVVKPQDKKQIREKVQASLLERIQDDLKSNQKESIDGQKDLFSLRNDFLMEHYARSAPGQMALFGETGSRSGKRQTRLNWDKSKHPRDEEGKFTEADGSKSSNADNSDRSRVELPRAKAGGERCPITGEWFEGGQIMPTHGMSQKQETKPSKGDGSGETPERSEDGKGRSSALRGVMSPEEVAAERERRQEQEQWDKLRDGELGKVRWFGDSPNHRAMSTDRTNLNDWSEWASEAGAEGIASLIEELEPVVHQRMDDAFSEHRRKWDAMSEAEKKHWAAPEDDDAEFYRDVIRKEAEQTADQSRKTRSHEKKIPGSHYARELIHEFLHDNYRPEGTEKISDLHLVNDAMTRAKDRQKEIYELAPPREPQVNPKHRTERPRQVEASQKKKPGRLPGDGTPGWQKVGGSNVFVDGDGKITKGCPGLKGEHVQDIIDESDDSREVREVRQAHAKAEGISGSEYTAKDRRRHSSQKSQQQHANAKEAAKQHGVATHRILAAMPEAHGVNAGQDADIESARQRARQMTGLNAGRIAKIENNYRDHSTVEGFEANAREFAAERPDLFDKDAHDTPAKVWDFIREGQQDLDSVHSLENAHAAAEMLKQRPSQPAGEDDSDDDGFWNESEFEDEDVSFDFGVNLKNSLQQAVADSVPF